MNGTTQIFRSFHRTASSTTGGWSLYNILIIALQLIIVIMLFSIYNSEHYGLIFGP